MNVPGSYYMDSNFSILYLNQAEENVSLMIKDSYVVLPMAIQGVRIFTIKNDFSSKAVSKLMGHSEEIITVDVYGDSQELITDCTVELAEFIEDVVPDIEKEDVTDKSNISSNHYRH